MKTPVEWLLEEIGSKNMGTFLEEKIKIALQMEKEYLEKLKEFDEWKEWKNK